MITRLALVVGIYFSVMFGHFYHLPCCMTLLIKKGTREMNALELSDDLEGAKLVILRLNDMLLQQQAEIEKLRSWVEMLVEVPFFNEIDHYRGIPVSILRKAQNK